MGQIVYLSEVPKAQDVKLFGDQPDVQNIPKWAEALDVNPQTLRREIARGRLGCIHIGKAIRITKAQITQYVQEVASNV